jgi:hypothetical protein
MDKLDLFDRSDGIPSFLLLDGHGSRFEVPFLEYITDEAHLWKVCIGVPYGTSYWQVGDSTEQNGCFKMALTKAKWELVEKKEKWGIAGTIDKTDIVGLVTYGGERSFTRVESNWKAVVEQGWGQLNSNLLLHPEINTQEQKKIRQDSKIQPDELNLMDGIAGSLMEKIVLFWNREAARTGENATEVLRQRKWTAEAALA